MVIPVPSKQHILRQGLNELGIDLDDQTQSQLLAYLELIIKWNKAYNLTAIRDPEDMVRLHLLDSLAIADLVARQVSLSSDPGMIDVGTGAGLPGVVLAILNPHIPVSLLDTNGKKCRFLNQVKIALGLNNIDVIQHRVENFKPQQPYSVVLSRAFATLKNMTDNARHLLSVDGRFLAMKGRYPDQELEELDKTLSFEKAYRLNIPGLDVERYLIEISFNQPR